MENEKSYPHLFYGYVVAAAGFTTWFVGWGAYALCFGVFFKPLLAEFHWTRAEISMVYSISLFIQATLGITTGWLTDRLGPRIVVTVFGSFLGWSFLLTSQISNLWQFILSYAVVGGIGASILNIPIMATVTRWFVIRRGLMTGIVQAGAGIGGFFLAPFSGWLIINYGWRTAAIIMGCFTATLMVLAGLFLIRDPGDIGQSPDGFMTDTSSQRPLRNNTAHFSSPPLRTYLRTAPFWMLTGIFASFGYIRSTLTAHTAAHVQDFGHSLADGANVLALISMASVIGRIGMGRLADIIGNRRTLIISYTVLTLVIVWLMTSANLWQFYAFGMIYGFGWGALAVLRFAVTAQVFGLASVGFIMGILGFSESVAATFSSYFGGLMFDLSGDYTTAFGICLAVSCLGLFLSWRLK